MHFTRIAVASMTTGIACAAPAALPLPAKSTHARSNFNVQLGPRLYYLVDNMDAGPLKDKLESRKEDPKSTTSFSISHRGAPLMFPEHSRQGHIAAARMGAGETGLAFSSQTATTLAVKCTEPFEPADLEKGTEASANCCTSDISLVEFKTLYAEMEAATFDALNTSQYPSIWQLITIGNVTKQLEPSTYALAAQEVGLEIITWSFERSVPLELAPGGYYYQSVSSLIKKDGDEYNVIDIIAQQVKATKIFADWPGTATYYANCFGLA